MQIVVTRACLLAACCSNEQELALVTRSDDHKLSQDIS
jgi:hypothetical protein